MVVQVDGEWRALQSTILEVLKTTELVIHPYNAKQPLLQDLHAVTSPLDGQTLPDSQQENEFFPDLRQETCLHVAVKV